jgi:tetratricopeptide (TPR) repeat protein
VTARTRTGVVVAALAALAAVVVVGAAVLSAEELPPPAGPQAQPKPLAGAPPLVLDLGLRTDDEAGDLRRAAELYEQGRRRQAAAIFARSDSLEAKLGLAFARWPGTLERVEQLGALFPRSALAQLHVGVARVWAGRAGATEAWREARDAEPDTLYSVRASSFLHPKFAPDLPVFVPEAPFPPELAELPPARQLERLRDGARSFTGRKGLAWRLHYGIALQRLGRPVSARRVYEEAAKRYPAEPEALAAAAVARFAKERPEAAFSRLGPLSGRFPRAATVRFHLGLLLLWSSQVDEAKRQLRLAEDAGATGSRLAGQARRYLQELEKAGGTG